MFFITNFVTCITNLLTRVTKFVTCIRNFVTNFLSADSENYHGLRKNFLAESKKYLHLHATFVPSRHLTHNFALALHKRSFQANSYSNVPCLSAPQFKADIFCYPQENFPKPVIVFTICAEKVCYKVCNTCYKPCNAY